MGNVAGASAEREKPLILFGLGGVGRALMRQIGEQRSLHRGEVRSAHSLSGPMRQQRRSRGAARRIHG